MAKFDFNPKDVLKLADDLSRLSKIQDDPRVDAVLEKAADRLTQELKDSIEEKKLVDSKQLLNSIAPSRVLRDEKRGKHIDVYPQGDREDGGRNAEVGFVNEYGADGRDIPARHWMSDVIDDKGNEIADMIAEGVADIIEEMFGE